MSRFRKEKGYRLKPMSNPSSMKLWRSLAAALLGIVMIGASATIFVGTASAADDPTLVQVPSNPTPINDPCGPDNADWGTIPADADIETNDYVLDFHFNNDSTRVIVDIIENAPVGYHFPDGTMTHDYGTAPDSGEACPPETTVIDVPAQPSVSDPCNPAGVTDNVTWNVPANTDTIHWAVQDNGDLRATIVADNTTFPDESRTHDYTKPADSGVACDTGGGGGGGSNGDNGTVKTHNVGTPTSDVNDEPKVDCTGFYLDAFGFDGVQQVSWHIVTDTHGDTVLSGTITLDDNGHGYTGKLDLPNGMYKLYWHFDGQNGADKHKVFKVEGDCNTPPPNTCPDGFDWDDLNDNGTVDDGECVMLPPPPEFQCPDGSTPSDVNGDGTIDVVDCQVIIVDPGPEQQNKPPHHSKPTYLPDTGWTARASAQHQQNSGSPVALWTLVGGILLLTAGSGNLGVAAIRRRKGGES